MAELAKLADLFSPRFRLYTFLNFPNRSVHGKGFHRTNEIAQLRRRNKLCLLACLSVRLIHLLLCPMVSIVHFNLHQFSLCAISLFAPVHIVYNDCVRHSNFSMNRLILPCFITFQWNCYVMYACSLSLAFRSNSIQFEYGCIWIAFFENTLTVCKIWLLWKIGFSFFISSIRHNWRKRNGILWKRCNSNDLSHFYVKRLSLI